MKRLIIWLYDKYCKFNKVILIMTLIASFLFGLIGVGPFLKSPIYQWLKSVSNSNPLFAEIFDYQDFVVDAIISSSMPTFFVFAAVMFAYDYENNNIDKINSISKYTLPFIRGTSKIVMMIGSVILGVACFGAYYLGKDVAIMYVAIVGLFFLGMGYLFRLGSNPILNQNSLLNNFAFHIGCLFTLLGVAAYLHGIVADPVRLWLTLPEAYKVNSLH